MSGCHISTGKGTGNMRIVGEGNHRGFALLEALVAVAVVAIISAVLVSNNTWQRMHLPRILGSEDLANSCRSYETGFKAEVKECLWGPQL